MAPYIDQADRRIFDYQIEQLFSSLDNLGPGEDWSAGHINYVFTRILNRWFKKESSYETICKIIGTVDCVGKEFYRIKAAVYEDIKMIDNGPVDD